MFFLKKHKQTVWVLHSSCTNQILFRQPILISIFLMFSSEAHTCVNTLTDRMLLLTPVYRKYTRQLECCYPGRAAVTESERECSFGFGVWVLLIGSVSMWLTYVALYICPLWLMNWCEWRYPSKRWQMTRRHEEPETLCSTLPYWGVHWLWEQPAFVLSATWRHNWHADIVMLWCWCRVWAYGRQGRYFSCTHIMTFIDLLVRAASWEHQQKITYSDP